MMACASKSSEVSFLTQLASGSGCFNFYKMINLLVAYLILFEIPEVLADEDHTAE